MTFDIATFGVASYSFSYYELGFIAIAAILVGAAKTGVQGAAMISVPLLALVFGAKESTGVMLPIMILADVFAIYYYHQHANWRDLKSLIPFALIGVVIGTVLGELMNGHVFSYAMVVIIFISLCIMAYKECQSSSKTSLLHERSQALWFTGSIGILGGIATMVGNLAGPVMAMYLLAMRLPKKQFIATAAWFFFIINLSKVPFHVFVWKTISWSSLSISLATLPLITLGAVIGVKIVNRISERYFRWFVILMTAVSALAMML